VVVASAAAVGAATAHGSRPAPDAAWTSFGRDAQIDSFTPAPAFTTEVKGFKLAWQTTLAGGVVAARPRGCPPLLAANSKSGELLVWRQDRLARGRHARIGLSDGVSAFVGAPSWSPVTQMLYDGGVVEHREGNELTGTVAIAIGPKCAITRRWFQVTGTGTEPEPLVAGDLVASTGGYAGGLVVSRAATGSVVWRYPIPAAAILPLIEAGGLLVGGDTNGNLYAFRPR